MPICSKSFLPKKVAVIFYSNIVIFFDFLIYFYLAETLSATFFPTTTDPSIAQLQTFGIFAAGYLARPFGGFVLGRYGDKKGRRPALMMSASFIAITSLITACLPTYAQAGIIAPILFLVARIVQGMSFGAYSALSWVFIGEHTPESKTGFYTSIVTSSFLAAVLATVFIFTMLFSSVSFDTLSSEVWRSVFVSSSAFGFLAVILISYLRETPVFLVNQTENAQPDERPCTEEDGPNYKRFHAIFLSTLLSFYMSSIFVVIALTLPQLISLRFSVDSSMLMAGNVLGILFFIFGTLFYGLLADKGNTGKVLMIGSLVLAIQMFAFYSSLQMGGSDYVLIMYALLGFSAGVISLCPLIMLHLFATKKRLMSISVIYNSTYAIIGGLLPAGLIHATTNITFSPVLYMMFVCFVGFIAGLYIYRLPKFNSLHNI